VCLLLKEEAREGKDRVGREFSDDLKQEIRQIAQRRRSQSALVSNFLIHISSRPRPR
jgi:hypothetical protein